MTLAQDKQSLTPGRRIELFDFDATAIGGILYRWVSSFKEPQPLTWQGNAYTPQPIKAEGFEVSGQGALPTPKLTVSNVLLLPGAIINEIGDPLGATLTRWVTFADYLDDGATPSPSDHFRPEVWRIERKTAQTKIAIEFELASAIDQEGRFLPGRQVLRDTCRHVYRVWDADLQAFSYARATCPYAGADNLAGGEEGPYFRANGEPTNDPAEDLCSKRLGDGCELRFGKKPLPFLGFPAVARVR